MQIRKVTVVLLSILLIILVGFNVYYQWNNLRLIGEIDRKVEIYTYVSRQNTNDALEAIANYREDMLKGFLASKKLFNTFANVICEQAGNLAVLQEQIKENQTIDVENVDVVKQANILIENRTLGALGSGTRIKLNNKHYILTCAHLVKERDDEIVGVWLDQSEYPLELVKIDVRSDLALFRVHKAKPGPYLEIAKEGPEAGSAVTVVGNPNGIRGVFTNGVVCREYSGYYMITNIIYFGNSGGAVVYKGQIVGVISSLATFNDFGVNIHYGFASGLDNINRFLEDFYAE